MPENSIDVYAVDLTGTLDKTTYDHLLRHVSPEKKTRIPRFYREEDRIRGLMAEILARSIIIRKTGLANHEIEFYTNEYGKPFLKNRDDLHFNLSHSGSWVVCAVDNHPIGIDVERIQSIDLDISKNYFSPDEHQDLLAKEDKFSYFFTLWSLKESYIKIVGKGLSLPLNSFSIKFSGSDNIRIKEEERLLENIYFTQYEIDKDYKMAVCAYRKDFPSNVQVKTMYQVAEEFLRDLINYKH
ncbi:MAG TPA: 4'-phosphopantetheinyl transferase superfamily protein [Candidatus Deferrimicrobium sp.]|nr:4'-phosphopantetheinyl transferase superfamily protein [Candidatus Deferrimicrobium sp.]